MGLPIINRDVIENGKDDDDDSWDDNNNKDKEEDKNNNINGTDDLDTLYGDDSSGSNINNVHVNLQARNTVDLYHDDTLISIVKIVNCLKRKWNTTWNVVVINDNEQLNMNGNVVIIDDNEQLNTNGNGVMIDDNDGGAREIVTIEDDNDSNNEFKDQEQKDNYINFTVNNYSSILFLIVYFK